ncbi:hypothetical protein [Pseudoxanthomonas mexicana]|uniref:hypothetical protein n=1 Tax=Pseudoxanthomonas mexicana TaxID=128785 RepID=UPI00398BA661
MKQLLAISVFFTAFSVNAAEPQDEKCAYDQEALLSLDEAAFDQDLPNGGWRKIGNISGCEAAAAELISAYRERHPNSSSTVAWHQGQMLASAGMNKQAIPILESSKKDPTQDIAGWNHYVDATIAFLSGDKEKLEKARDRLAAVPYDAAPGMPPLVDGHVEFTTQPDQPPVRMRWPPNIDVVDGLVKCFGKSYGEAYGPSCRPDGS